MLGQAATALALGKIWVSTIPLAAPTQSPNLAPTQPESAWQWGQGRERGGEAEAEGVPGSPSHQNQSRFM